MENSEGVITLPIRARVSRKVFFNRFQSEFMGEIQPADTTIGRLIRWQNEKLIGDFAQRMIA
jgi:hypothetical protein